MSASLVGSEMCIRDRPQTHDQMAIKRPKRARAAHVPGARARSTRTAAVSYTHLTLPTCSV
eukprot:2230454-Alexandrium_andersonii.AAC.1